LTCDDDGSTSALQTEDITVYPSNVEEFVTIAGDDCSVSVGIDEACITEEGGAFLNVEPDGYTAEPGESGTWTINYNFVDKLGFNPCPDGSLSGSIEYDYDCFDPCGNFAGEMGGASTFVCGNNGFIVSPIENEAIVDAGSTLVFVLHDGTSSQIGPNIYAVVGQGAPIMNDGSIPTNVTLCFSAVVGDQLDANGIPQPDGCYDISDDCQPVIFLSPIEINATEICDPETGQYDVQVMINGGGPGFFPGHTYEVIGALSGEVLASEFITFGPFNSGDTYSFEVIEDGKGCEIAFEGSATCEVTPDCDAGVLGGNAFVCDGEFALANTIGAQFDPNNSELIYVLHDGDSDALGSNIYQTASDGIFTNDGSIPTNVTLCITAVVGDNVGPDNIPLDSGSGGCYDISNCFQAVFLDPITVETTEICDDETGQYTVEVIISGGGPEFFVGHAYTLTGDFEGNVEVDETTVLGPFDSNYTYSFNVTEDGKGCLIADAIEGTADCGIFTPGSDVLFTIQVLNQGNIDANNIEITDYIPAGMTLSTSDNNGWTASGSNATTTVSTIPAGASEILSILLTIDASQGAGSLVNYAEISNDDGDDVDSNTDQDISNDAGGVPNSSTDNSTNGVKGGTDEDDHDPAQIDVTIPAVYDLALVKTVSSSGPFMPGDDVTFTIEVINQGGVDANNIEVTDYIPSGMTLSTNDSNGWTVSGSNATATIVSIAAGTSATIDIILTIDAGQAAGPIVKDQDAGNDAGGVPNSSTDNSTDGTKGGDDEDDHDPAQIDVTVPSVYDLALVKTVSSSGPFMPGDNVTFTIEVFNQGDVDANNIEVTDYIPSGLSLSTSDNNGWIVNGSLATATISSIPSGASAVIGIVLTIDADQAAGPIVNYAEISDDDGDDADSNTDQDAGNDAGGVPNSSTDNSTDGTKGGTDEDDHDPAQIDITVPAIYDLALIKTVASTGPFMPGVDVTFNIEVINQGDVDANNIEVTDYIPSELSLSTNDNNGWIVNGSLATVSITSIPAGSSTIIEIVLTVDADFPQGTIVNYAEISDDDGDDVDSMTDQDISNDVGGDPNSPTDNSIIGNGIAGGIDEDDHDPAQITIMTAIETGCTDPCAPNYDPTAEVNDGSCQTYNMDCNTDCTLGDLEVWNAETCSCIISLPTVLGCMDMNACNFDTNANCEDNSLCDYGNTSCADPCNPVPGCTNPDACNYDPNACVDNSSCDLGDPNCADPCNPVPGCTNPAACNYNPNACVENGTCDLGNVTCADPCNPVPGCTNSSACNYNPNACEEDGTCDFGNVACADPCNPTSGCTNPAACNYDANACVDDGSCDFGDTTCPASPCNPTPGCTDPSACNYNPNACVDNGTCQAAPVCNTDPCVGDITTISSNGCLCELVTPQVLGCTDPAACNYDAAANCDNGSCEPCEVFDLALIKDISPNLTAANGDIYCPGDEVRFSIAVFNQGDFSAIDIEITDYIPEGMSLSDNPANDIWLVNGSMAITTIPFIEANGGVVGLTIFLTIDEDYGGATLENYAEISGDNGDDIDSNADNILGNDAGGVPNTPADNDINGVKGGVDEDDHDGDIIYLCDPDAVHDLALTKVRSGSGITEYCPGDDVTFIISVTNQGNVSAYNTEVIDYIPDGFSLSSNDVNGWTTDGSIAMNIITFLDAGQTVDLPIVLTIGADQPAGTVINYAEISGSSGDDIDSTPDTDPNNDSEAEDDHDSEEITILEECDDPQGFDLALTKQVAAGQTPPFGAGDQVTFTITVYNQGNVTATNVGVIDYAPTVLLLNDSDWTDIGNNNATTVIPGPIAPGAAATVDITFIVDPELFHSKEIANYAEIQFATDENGNPATDIDSNFDSSVGNDAGGAPGTPADDYIDGDGTGGQGDGVAATDEDDADPAIISVVAQACNAGVLPTYLYSCAGGVISVSASGAVIPSGYEFVYILHNGDENNFGDIIDINTTGVFDIGTYPTNTPLTVQTLVGPPKPVPSDLPVLCDLSNAATLVFLDPIEIVADYTCDSSTEEYTVTFTITGGLPSFDASQTYTVTGDYSSNVTANTPITFGPIADTSYEIYVSDEGGCTGTETEIVECVKLPITLISYDGEAQQNGNMLKWVTGTETENEYFTLEVSNDGLEFEKIATVEGAGTSLVANEYSFLHRTALSGLSYYRLSQTDFDGTAVDVGIVEIVRGESALGIISLTPVPVIDNLQLTYTASEDVPTEIEVIDVIGHALMHFENVNQGGINTMEVNVAELPAGVYFVRIKTGENMVSQKFIKE